MCGCKNIIGIVINADIPDSVILRAVKFTGWNFFCFLSIKGAGTVRGCELIQGTVIKNIIIYVICLFTAESVDRQL